MKAYSCSVCGYLYDEESAEKNSDGLTIPFEEIFPEWVCPICSVKQDLFIEVIASSDATEKQVLRSKNNL